MIVLAAICNAITLISWTYAYQADNSGFLMLIENEILIYMFLCDTLIFGETFQSIELIFTVVILLVVIGITVLRLKTKKAAERKKK